MKTGRHRGASSRAIAARRAPGRFGRKTEAPNLFEKEAIALFDYDAAFRRGAARGVVGIPRALNMYENYPFWFTFFTKLGYRVILSDRRRRKPTRRASSLCRASRVLSGEAFARAYHEPALTSIPTSSGCRSKWERQEDATAGNHYNCPIVASYSEALRLNIDELRTSDAAFLSPWLPYDNKGAPEEAPVRRADGELRRRTCVDARPLTQAEVDAAVDAAWAEDEAFKDDIRAKARKRCAGWKRPVRTASCLRGAPTINDPEINHAIPELLTSFGLAVPTEDSIAHLGTLERPIRVVDQWMYHTRLYAAAKVATQRDDLDLIQLNSSDAADAPDHRSGAGDARGLRARCTRCSRSTRCPTWRRARIRVHVPCLPRPWTAPTRGGRRRPPGVAAGGHEQGIQRAIGRSRGRAPGTAPCQDAYG